MRGTGVSQYGAVRPEIMWANREGFRLVIPSCYRVPLADERVIASDTVRGLTVSTPGPFAPSAPRASP